MGLGMVGEGSGGEIGDGERGEEAGKGGEMEEEGRDKKEMEEERGDGEEAESKIEGRGTTEGERGGVK